MDFNHSELQRMLRDSAERYLGDRYTLEHRRALRATSDGLDREGWATFAELGWLALAVSEAQGGLGGSLGDIAVLSTALGAKLVTAPFASTAVLATHILSNAEHPCVETLTAVAHGKVRIALAHGEAGERYGDGGARRTTIRRDGNQLALDGQKMLALDAPSAGRLIVSATMQDRLVLVLVDPGAEGVTLEPYPLIDGSRAADISFDGVRLGGDAILASDGQMVLDEAIDRASICLMAQAVGSMEACLTICAAYLKERQQFGQPIGKFQALQHIMADMFVAAHQARSALYQAISAIDADPPDRQRAVSLAKVTIGEASQLVSRQAIQLHGGYGVTDEYEVSHHYRRLLVLEKSYGDIDHHIRRLG